MTKKMTNKSQAKHLKNRSQRQNKARGMRGAGIHAERAQKTVEFNRQKVSELIARGAVINGPQLQKSDVVNLVNYTIETNAGISSVIETMEILEREKKLVINEELRALFDEHDKEVIRFNENAEVIMMVLSGDGTLNDLPGDILMDTGFRSDRLATDLAPKILEVAKDYATMVDTYQKEHYPTMTYREVMFKVALERVQRIQPKYATPINIDAEEVGEDVYEETME